MDVETCHLLAIKDATTAHVSSEYQELCIYRKGTFVVIIQILLSVKCCIYTPLYNSKQVDKLHLDRSSGKLFQNANYGSAIYWMQEVQRRRSHSIGLERGWRNKRVAPCYIFIARAILANVSAWNVNRLDWIIITSSIKYFCTIS